MRGLLICSALAAGVTAALSGCGGDGDSGGGGSGGNNGGGGSQQTLTSYVGTTGVFAAWGNGVTGNANATMTGTYAGKRQLLRGTVDPITAVDLGQLAGVEIYKYSDGHIYALDMTSTSTPAAQQISSESAATIDDTCSLNGTQVTGANYDYLGVNFVADLNNPTNSRYLYRLPGPDGVCNTADDIIRMVTPSMSATTAPITLPAMPSAVTHDALGGISGFVVKSGASLILYDANFANPLVLATFSTPIGVAAVIPEGTTQGFPTGELYVVDGNIVYVNYASPSVSPPLFAIPNWTSTLPHAIFAASPTTVYFAVNVPASGSTAASTSLYSMPADGSAAPSLITTYPGYTSEMQFPVASTNLIYSTSSNGAYSIYALPQSGATPVQVLTSTQNLGNFTATATSVYYTTWTQTTNTTALTMTRTGTQSGIVGVDGSVLMPPVANSMFATGGEYVPWSLPPSVITQTALETVFQVQNLTPVTVSSASTGYTYTIDGVAGGTVTAIDTASNQSVATLGVVPGGTATFLTATFRADDHSGFIEGSTYTSTQDPGTRNLYFLNSHSSSTLELITRNL
jgi:hypothetical protein